MIEPTDDDIAEALRLSGYAFTPECVGDVRQELCMRHSLILTHARTIAKLRIAVGALEHKGYAYAITSQALHQIKG